MIKILKKLKIKRYWLWISGNLQPDLQNLLEIVRWVHPAIQPPFIQTVVAIFTVSRPWLPVLSLTFLHRHTPQMTADIAPISGNPLREIYQVYAPCPSLCACVLREIKSFCFLLISCTNNFCSFLLAWRYWSIMWDDSIWSGLVGRNSTSRKLSCVQGAVQGPHY
jgi:hypothetical protein